MNSNYIKVKDHPNLVRDKSSNAILNIDDAALNKYKLERDFILKAKKVVEEQPKIKEEISEIKQMLQQLLKK